MTRARNVYTVSGVRVCVDREDGGLPGAVGVCGALNVCVGTCVCVWAPVCVCGCGVAGQTWTASARLVESMTGSSTEHRTEDGVLL